MGPFWRWQSLRCFSDNTHRDIVLNEQGIANSYLGTYGNTSVYTGATAITDGTGLDELLREANLATEADALKTAIEDAQAAIEVINGKAGTETFDLQIAPGNTTGNADVRAAIDALDITTGDIRQDTEENI